MIPPLVATDVTDLPNRSNDYSKCHLIINIITNGSQIKN